MNDTNPIRILMTGVHDFPAPNGRAKHFKTWSTGKQILKCLWKELWTDGIGTRTDPFKSAGSTRVPD